jgi:hypothetical protein
MMEPSSRLGSYEIAGRLGQDGRYVISSDRDGGLGLFLQLADGSGMAERPAKSDEAAIQYYPQVHPSGRA